MSIIGWKTMLKGFYVFFFVKLMYLSYSIYKKILDRDWFSERLFRHVIASNFVSVIVYQQLDTYPIRTSITCVLMASFLVFPTLFQTYAKHYWLFRSKFVVNAIY